MHFLGQPVPYFEPGSPSSSWRSSRSRNLTVKFLRRCTNIMSCTYDTPKARFDDLLLDKRAIARYVPLPSSRLNSNKDSTPERYSTRLSSTASLLASEIFNVSPHQFMWSTSGNHVIILLRSNVSWYVDRRFMICLVKSHYRTLKHSRWAPI